MDQWEWSVARSAKRKRSRHAKHSSSAERAENVRKFGARSLAENVANGHESYARMQVWKGGKLENDIVVQARLGAQELAAIARYCAQQGKIAACRSFQAIVAEAVRDYVWQYCEKEVMEYEDAIRYLTNAGLLRGNTRRMSQSAITRNLQRIELNQSHQESEEQATLAEEIPEYIQQAVKEATEQFTLQQEQNNLSGINGPEQKAAAQARREAEVQASIDRVVFKGGLTVEEQMERAELQRKLRFLHEDIAREEQSEGRSEDHLHALQILVDAALQRLQELQR